MKTERIHSFVSVVIAALGLSFPPVHGAETSVNQKPPVEKLVQSYNAFAFNLFSEITKRGSTPVQMIMNFGFMTVLSGEIIYLAAPQPVSRCNPATEASSLHTASPNHDTLPA